MLCRRFIVRIGSHAGNETRIGYGDRWSRCCTKCAITEAMQSIECGGMIVYEVMRECKVTDRTEGAPGRKTIGMNEMLESVKVVTNSYHRQNR